MDLWPVAIVLFASTLTRSTFGFGDALVSMPLLALFLPVSEVVSPLVAANSITTSLLIVGQDWRAINWRNLWRLILFAMLGIPVGMWWLEHANEQMVKLILGGVILGFALYSLIRPRLFLRSDSALWLFAFLSGVLGGAYNAFGPPLVIYGALRRWGPQEFRSTMQGYILPLSVFILVSHFVRGFDGGQVSRCYLFSLSFSVIAVFIGRSIHARFEGEGFRKAIFVMLIAIAALLIVRSI